MDVSGGCRKNRGAKCTSVLPYWEKGRCNILTALLLVGIQLVVQLRYFVRFSKNIFMSRFTMSL